MNRQSAHKVANSAIEKERPMTTQRLASPSDTLLSTGEVMAKLRIGRTTLWEMEKRQELPAAIFLNQRCKRWRASDIDAFIAGKSA